MDKFEPLLHEELILLDYEADSRDELLKKLAAVLEEKGFVKASYAQGIISREELYPTGLPTTGVKIAIPHTDACHVNKPAILVAKLIKPVTFKEMGNGVNDVEARLVFMLAVKNPETHIQMLSKLMSIFSDRDKLTGIFESATKREVMDRLAAVLTQ